MDNPAKQADGRPVRPEFAEDVYGSGRTTSTNVGTSEICGSALAQRRSANLPKLKELCAAGSSSELNITSTECPLASARASQMHALDFQYADSDSYQAELAELYTYSEMDEFSINFECYGRYMRERKKEPIWYSLPTREKAKILQSLVESFESVEPEQRLEAVRIILYILQGAYGDFTELDAKDSDKWSTEVWPNERSANESETNEDGNGLDIADKWFGRDQGTGGYESDCLIRAALNAYHFYEQGLYQSLCSLLRLEDSLPLERYADHSRQSSVSNSRSASHMDLAASSDGGGASGSASGTLERRRSKRSATLADNERIRVTINCIYHLVESIRREELIEKIAQECSDSLYEIEHQRQNAPKYTIQKLHSLRRQFLSELEEPLEQGKEPLLIHLFGMMPPFVRGKTPHYPIKKILLLCWKVLLSTLGGMKWLREEKARKRQECGLQPIEDTIQGAAQMNPVLNCDGAAGGGLLGLSLGLGGAGALGRVDAETGTITGQLGRKVRSIHHPVRPFNRQVACSSSSSVQDKSSDQQDVNHRQRSNAISQDEEKEEDENMNRREDNQKFAEEVDEAIVDVEEENDEPEQLLEEDGSNLLDQVLEELSSPSEDDQHEKGIDKARGDDETIRDETSEEGATPQPHPHGEANPLSATMTKSHLPPKIMVSTQQWQSSENNEDAKIQCENVDRTKVKSLKKSENEKMKVMEQISANFKNLVLINIDRKHKPRDNAEGGDQTPKACESPLKMNNPWPPPPPPGLPWRPKVRESDIENFLQMERLKYFDFQLPGDSTTVFGLPNPIVEGSVAAMRRNLYTPLSDLQIKSDGLYNKYPFSQKEFIEDTQTERLYSRILPNMTEYVIALLKVILASLPSSKAKTDAVTILSDVLTPETDTNEVLSNSISMDLSNFIHGCGVLEETVRVAIDINRHKEITCKAASAIIILLLKHLRLNHIYQFENFAQYLVLANCLPLVLKFLDQNICRYFQSKHELVPFNYPQCALHFVRNGNEWPSLTLDNVDGGGGISDSPSYFLWRNVFSSINLLRVINKLTKAKQARTMMLVVYKSAPVLKRCMRVKLGIFQLYVLKLLKMQARYLGRQWRKTNMELISAVYLRVRHRLNDDWAYANEITRTKQFDFQREENELGIAIKRFNARRYPQIMKEHQSSGDGGGTGAVGDEQQQDRLTFTDPGKQGLVDDWDPKEWEPRDNSLQSALAWEPQFSDRFSQNYERWLEEEVFGQQTDWDSLLRNSRGLLDIYC